MNKKVILTVIASFAGILLLAAVGWYVYYLSQFGNYSDPLLKFSVKYPSQWKVNPTPMPGVAVAFLSPKETALDVFQENFNVSTQEVPPESASLASFSALITKQMNAVFKSNIKILDDKNIQLGGRMAHRLMFEAPTPDALTSVIIWTIVRERAYIVTYAGKTKKYLETKDIVEASLNSLQIQ